MLTVRPCFPLQVHQFVAYCSGARRNRCLIDPRRRGLGEPVLVLVVALLGKHVLPTLYPQMYCFVEGQPGMGIGQARAFASDLLSGVRNLFNEAAQLEMERLVAADVNAQLLAAGVSPEEASRRAGAAGREAAEARRAQRGEITTRVAATEQDLCLVRDVMASEALRRNRSLVVDAYDATVEW